MKDVITRGSIACAVVAVAVLGAAAVGYSVGDRRTTNPTVVEQLVSTSPTQADWKVPAPPAWEPVITNPRLQVEDPAVDTLTPIRPANGGGYQ